MVFTKYDVKILANIMDKNEKNKGLSKMSGTTVQEIVQKTKYSDRKVRLTLKKLIEAGMADYGVAQGRTRTYYVLPKGLEELNSLYEIMVREDDE